jgi:hypothetical protein
MGTHLKCIVNPRSFSVLSIRIAIGKKRRKHCVQIHRSTLKHSFQCRIDNVEFFPSRMSSKK